MNRHHGWGRRRDRLTNPLRINVERSRLEVHKDGDGTDSGDCGGTRDERDGRNNDFIARPNSEHGKSQFQCYSTVECTDTVPRELVSDKAAIELSDKAMK